MFKYIDKRPYEPYSCRKISDLAKGNESFLQRLALLHTLDVHKGCVNSVIWDDRGEILLSGSDDQHLVISKPWSNDLPFKIHTAHRANIFSAKFIPFTANQQIISCAGDGILIYTDVCKISETNDCKFTCHVGTAYDIVTVANDPHSFFSSGEDGTVRWFDLRVKTSCNVQECKEDILLNMRRAVTSLAVNPMVHYQLAVATQDSCIHVYDRRMLGTKTHDSYLSESNKAVLMKMKPEGLEGKAHRITSLKYNSSGNEILASYSSDYLYLFDTQNFSEVNVEMTVDDDVDHDSGPTLKRLRLRGDWSDTGPQALPESQLSNQAEDVGQARPTLHSTLMQRMTDILSRMLHNPSPSRRRETRRTSAGDPITEISESEGSILSERVASMESLMRNDDSDNIEGRTSPTSHSRVTGSINAISSNSSQVEASANPITTIDNESVEDDATHESLTCSKSSPPMKQSESSKNNSCKEIEIDQEQSDVNMESSIDEPSTTVCDNNESITIDDSIASTSQFNVICDNKLKNSSEITPEPSCSTLEVSVEKSTIKGICASDAKSEYPVTPSTSHSSDSDKLSGRLSQSVDDGREDTENKPRSAANLRMASVINKVVQKVRNEKKSMNEPCGGRTVPNAKLLKRFVGHRNARTMIKEACFWGEKHVMSGSDCGRVFVWEKSSGRIVMLWEADRHVVNCVQPHPTLPVLATSGIDYDIKLWAPILEDPNFDEEGASEIAKRNEMLLAETRDTVTVPATFMIRMLASLNQLRQDRLRNQQDNNESMDEDNFD